MGRAASKDDGPNFVSADVLNRLREDIIRNRIPSGTRLPFALLQQEYGASVGSIREALSHLVSQALVEVDVGRGYKVAPMSRGDLLDISELRVDIERKALSSSIGNGGEEWELEVVNAFHLLNRVEGKTGALSDDPSWSQRHRSFHKALVNACRSRWLLHFHAMLFDQASRYRALSQRVRPPGEDRRNEHRLIMEATLDRDAGKACDLAVAHITKTTNDILEYSTALAD